MYSQSSDVQNLKPDTTKMYLRSKMKLTRRKTSQTKVEASIVHFTGNENDGSHSRQQEKDYKTFKTKTLVTCSLLDIRNNNQLGSR